MIGIASPEDVEFPAWVQTIVICAGACGLTAELAAQDAGGDGQQQQLAAHEMVAVESDGFRHRRAGGEDHQGAEQNDQ